ncbi:serine O-acetyltransferase [Pedobacter sandarakinus]|uniref:serine O-acetyltransferase n=1 Tax=Pedobacter sandarakinus TaxID=353156 RepID=UPI002246520D|nr:serine acetyltransferase [Pedobacter sandarakinus]MCX2573632.1 serine acetyltransferase [Pedobacter sandarakinus]
MSDDFLNYLLNKRASNSTIPSNDVIALWATKIVDLLYPEHKTFELSVQQDLLSYINDLKAALYTISSASCNEDIKDYRLLSEQFFDHLPELYRLLNTDIEAIYKGDPAAVSKFEVIRTYPGFYAICFYRIAHALHQLGLSLIPRILTEHAHTKTGIDIHPGAVIGPYFYIDHGTGVVIGETTVIGEYVKIYQGVTLGALSVKKVLAGSKRHPTVENGVVIYSGATILGGETIIGNDSIIGGNVWLTESVPPFSMVYHSPTITIRNIKQQN